MTGYKIFSRTGSIRERRLFFITSEGVETEINYIRDLCRSARVSPTFKGGLGRGMAHVKKAIRTLGAESKQFEQAWCIFDRDDSLIQDIKDAITLAHKNGIQVAYSSKCLELWFLLHFQRVDSDFETKTICQKLNKHFQNEFSIEYDKTDTNLFRLLEGRTETAIQNANILFDECNCVIGSEMVDKSPITTMHKLVQAIQSQ